MKSPRKNRRSANQSEFQHDGKIVGYRQWGLNRRYRLESPYTGSEWPVRSERARRAPGMSGAVGWYAYYTLQACDVREFREFKGQKIAGAVAAWGETFVYPTGFRAEFAEVCALCYAIDWPKPFIAALRAIASEYGAQLCTHDDLPTIVEEYGDPIDKGYYDKLPHNMYPADHSW